MSINNNGNNNFNNTGDNNDFRRIYNCYTGQQKSLNRSYLFDFCEKFSRLELTSESGYNIDLASDITDKMNYNEIDIYKDIFQESEHYYDDVETILQEMPMREKIITNINKKYKKIKKFGNWNDKDHLCELVFQDLYGILVNNKNSNAIMEEDATEAIHAIMYYTFVKCKLLDPIPKN